MEDMDEVYRLHAQAVYKYLLSLCRSEAQAEELTQETFYEAVKSIDRFDGRCKISVWLCQIGKHLWYKSLRKSGREEPLGEAPELPVPSAEEALIMSEDKTALLKAVHALPQLRDGQFSFEARMGCGFGACMGCTIPVKGGYKRICKDGPILYKEEIVW